MKNEIQIGLHKEAVTETKRKIVI